MELPRTEKFIEEGIRMYKLIHSGSYGLFSSSSPTYDYRTVYDLEEAIQLNQNGWYFVKYNDTFHSIVLNLYRDLKEVE